MLKGKEKIQYFRTYDLKINDEVVGGIYSIWTLIDIEKRRIVRPQKVGITIPECEEYSSFVEKYEPLFRYRDLKKFKQEKSCIVILI